MIGLDTNILARFLLADDVGQHDAAGRLIDDAACSYWVPVTVVLELSWVLKGRGVPGPAAARAILEARGPRADAMARGVEALLVRADDRDGG